jgi:hypothetical protein
LLRFAGAAADLLAGKNSKWNQASQLHPVAMIAAGLGNENYPTAQVVPASERNNAREQEEMVTLSDGRTMKRKHFERLSKQGVDPKGSLTKLDGSEQTYVDYFAEQDARPTPEQAAAAAEKKAEEKHYSATKRVAGKYLDDAISSAYFKVSNSSDQRREIAKVLNQMRAEADAEKAKGTSAGLIKAAKIEAEMVGKAGELAGMDRPPGGMFAPDSLAAVGGIIGGAGIAADPGLNVAQDMRSILQDLLQEYKLTNNVLRENHGPMQQLR